MVSQHFFSSWICTRAGLGKDKLVCASLSVCSDGSQMVGLKLSEGSLMQGLVPAVGRLKQRQVGTAWALLVPFFPLNYNISSSSHHPFSLFLCDLGHHGSSQTLSTVVTAIVTFITFYRSQENIMKGKVHRGPEGVGWDASSHTCLEQRCYVFVILGLEIFKKYRVEKLCF